MRSQGCTIQQTLTPEAATVVKQAVVLAKRRGHAQVTPLHVANTMLSISTGLFRAVCLQSHAHPLQCRALELCFNVALNRLPTLTTPGPMLGPISAHNHYPAIANALIASFKRAQAHQRRGSIENQHQPLLTVKIEMEQLIISVLDDPSVSRVMKEAGFSSTLVKSKVEQAISVKLGSQNHDPNNKIKSKVSNNTTNNDNNLCSENNGSDEMVKSRPLDEDVKSLIDCLVKKNKRNSVVVVGECIEMLEGLIKQVKLKVEKNDDHVLHEGLKYVKFVHFDINSYGNLSKQEVDQKIIELKCLVKSCCVENNEGVILYLDDLKWIKEMKSISNNILGDQYQPRCSYCPIDHMVMEIRKLILDYFEFPKLWLLGIATFQTYMRCKSGQPSLESILSLQAITFPDDSLGLSLIPDSDLPSPLTSKKGDNSGSSGLMLEGGGGEVNMEVQPLPSWLQKHKDENNQKSIHINNGDKDSIPVKDLWKRWSSFGALSTHASPSPLSSSPTFERSLSFSSIAPSSSTSNLSFDHHHLTLKTSHQSIEPKNYWVSDPIRKANEPSFTLYIQNNHNKEHLQQNHSPYISSNTSLTPTSTSSSDIMDQIELQCSIPRRFNECNIESLKLISNALEQKVPRHKEIMVDIASTILQCRSRMTSRKGNTYSLKGINNKEETWLFFQGVDFDAKEMIARELAKVIFGSQDKFVTISPSSFSSTKVVDSLDHDCRYKRLRDEQSCSYIERFAKEISSDPHRVFFVEDIDQVDYSSLIRIKKAIERGTIPMFSSKEEVSFGDAIIILSCENFRSRSRACSPSTKHKQEITPREVDQKNTILGDGVPLEVTISPSISLDLNISINDEDEDDDVCDVNHGESMDEIGLLSTVDKCIVFKNHHEIQESF